MTKRSLRQRKRKRKRKLKGGPEGPLFFYNPFIRDSCSGFLFGVLIRDYENVPCLYETYFVSVSESLQVNLPASLPHTKAALQAAWHFTK